MSKNNKKDIVADQLTPSSEEPQKQTIAERIIELGRANCELFTDDDGEAFATFTGPHGERQTLRIESRNFRMLLGHWYKQHTGRFTKQEHIKEASETLVSYAIYDGNRQTVHCRVACYQGYYYIDLCNDKWQVLKVSKFGWKLLDQSPVKFIRSSSMRPLPIPERGGDISELWQFINIPENQRLLVIAWMIEAFRPDTQKPVLELLGSHGTGKSFSTANIRAFIDPNKSMLRAIPKSIDDLFVSSSSSWVQTYENVSSLPRSFQDAMCQISTGAGYAKRKLHTDIDEIAIEIKRPQILNGITPLATRQDLADRTVSIELPLITPEQRQEERTLTERFNAASPKIFGALLQLMINALKELPSVTLDEMPRMADFALLGEAVARSLKLPNGTFNMQLRENQNELMLNALESSPAAIAVLELARSSYSSQVFSGTYKQLLAKLEPYKSNDFEGWPKSAKGLADLLKRQAPGLKIAGVNISFLPRSNNGYVVAITKRTEEISSSCSPSSHPSNGSEHSELHEHNSCVSDQGDDLAEVVI